jgi:hypothetical protein
MNEQTIKLTNTLTNKQTKKEKDKTKKKNPTNNLLYQQKRLFLSYLNIFHEVDCVYNRYHGVDGGDVQQ